LCDFECMHMMGASSVTSDVEAEDSTPAFLFFCKILMRGPKRNSFRFVCEYVRTKASLSK